MVKYSGLLETFNALADPSRVAIVERLARGEASSSELAGPLGLSLPAFAKHLKVLEASGLVATRKQGRVRLCRIKNEPLKDVETWARSRREMWDRTLDSLGAHLEKGRKP